MNRIRIFKHRIAVFCLTLIFVFTYLVPVYAFDSLECHIIKYTQEKLLQTLETSKVQNTIFDVKTMKLPSESEELKTKMDKQANDMLLLDTITENDNCVAYVAMNPKTYEIAIFTVNLTKEKHDFQIEIVADKVVGSKVDVYTNQKTAEAFEEYIADEQPKTDTVVEVKTEDEVLYDNIPAQSDDPVAKQSSQVDTEPDENSFVKTKKLAEYVLAEEKTLETGEAAKPTTSEITKDVSLPKNSATSAEPAAKEDTIVNNIEDELNNEDKSDKLVTKSVDVGNVAKYKMEVPSDSVGVFRTSLVIATPQNQFEYLPVNFYDYNEFISFGGGQADGWTGENSGVYQGIAQNTLDAYGKFISKNGVQPFPQSNTNGKGFSLTDYCNAKFPFSVDGEGYYEYDSDKEGVYLNNTSKTFEIRNPNGPYPTTFNRTLDTEGRRWGFFPLNQEGDDVPSYLFGMDLTIKFKMPANRKAKNKDMIFELNGDDDVWIYVDGKLALDLGGIHDAMGGSINFTTGEIVHERVYNSSSGRNQPVVWNLYNKTNAQINVGINKADGAEHTLQVFYMERGSSGSNLKMKFNIPIDDEPPIPKNVISITKEVVGQSGDAANNQMFYFNAVHQTPIIDYLKNFTYTVDGVERQTDANGYFWLKNGETADFDISVPMRVTEADYTSDYDTTWKFENEDTSYSGRESLWLSSGDHVVFKNTYKNVQKGVRVTKTVIGYNTAIGESPSFTFTIRDENKKALKYAQYIINGETKQADKNGRFSLKDGETAEFNVSTPVYIKENENDYYSTSWILDSIRPDYCTEDGTCGAITGNQSTKVSIGDKVTFYNTYKYSNWLGSLTIYNNLTSSTSDDNTNFNFNLSFNQKAYNGKVDIYKDRSFVETRDVVNGNLSIKANQCAYISSIPLITNYRVSESDSIGYKLRRITQDRILITGRNYVDGTILNIYGSQVQFFNEKLPTGSITVQTDLGNVKTQGNPVFVYRLEKMDSKGYVIAVIYDYVCFNDGESEIKSVIFKNLPLDDYYYNYRIVQEPALRYSVTDDMTINNGSGTKHLSMSYIYLAKQNPDATVTFRYNKTNDKYFTSSSAVRNKITIDLSNQNSKANPTNPTKPSQGGGSWVYHYNDDDDEYDD